MNRAHRLHFVVAAVIVCFAPPGCRTIASRPDRQTLDHFATVDAIELTVDRSSTSTDDPVEIARLRDIYSSAKWKPYPTVLPAQKYRISCLGNGKELFSLAYAGYLMEIEAYDKVRYASLSDEDREWLDDLIERNGLPTLASLRSAK